MTREHPRLNRLLCRRVGEIVAVFAAGLGIGVGAAAIASFGGSGHHVSARTLPGTPAKTTPSAATTKPTHAVTKAATALAASPAAVLRAGSSGSFARLNAEFGGAVELAVEPLGEGRQQVLGHDTPAHGWSTTKVPVLAALLRARGAEGLTPEEDTWARSAITESSNEAVLALFKDLERLRGGLVPASSYMQGLLLESGDEETRVATARPPPSAVTTFGQTEWRPSQAVKFFSALARGCLLSATKTQYVLDLMASVVPGESWGLGSVGFPSAAFKGGWGPEPNEPYAELVRQSGIVDPDSDRAVAVSIVAFAPAFESGTEMVTKTARWLKEHLLLLPRPRTRCTNR